MNVCHVTPLAPVKSGISRYSEELLLHLKEKGVDSFALSTGNAGGRLDVVKFSWRGRGQALAEVERRQPALVHYQHGASYKNYFVIYSNLAMSRRLKLPAVITVHDAPFVSLVRLHKVEPVRRLVWRHLSKRLEARLCGLADAIIVHSEFNRDLIRRYYPGVEDKVSVIPHGIDLKKYEGNRQKARARLSLTDRDTLVVSGGLVYPGKGFAELLKSFSQLDTGVKLAIFGDGPFLPELKRIASELGLGDRVSLRGFVPEEEMIDLLSAADAAVLLKKTTVGETSGVLVNALAAGAPIVATDIGSNRELVADGVNGLLVKPGDERALTGALKTLLDNPSLRAEMGLKSRNVAESLSWDKVCDKIVRIYEKVTGVRVY